MDDAEYSSTATDNVYRKTSDHRSSLSYDVAAGCNERRAAGRQASRQAVVSPVRRGRTKLMSIVIVIVTAMAMVACCQCCDPSATEIYILYSVQSNSTPQCSTHTSTAHG